jgi:PKD repeat protein
MRRRLWLVALLSSAMLSGLVPAPASAADPPPLPNSIAAVGDSITQAASSGGSLGTDYPENSWSAGTNSTVNSHYLRLLAWNQAISGHNYNRSVSGAKMIDLNAQMQQIVALKPEYATVLIGGNDLCTDTASQMTSVSTFRSQFVTAMNTLSAGSPTTNVYVVSIPNVYHLWEIFKDNFWARFIWSIGNICQSLLANPTSTDAVDVARRASVAQRNVDFNTQLAEVCATYVACLFDNNAVYNTEFTTSDAAGDYFHPSISGQAKLALVSWNAGYWAAGPPPANQAPVASFTSSCTDLACSFDGSGSTDADGTIVGYAWTFGTDGSGSGATTDHTFSTAGTYNVTLTVTDDDGAVDSVFHGVTVSAPPPLSGTVTLESLAGAASVRRGGWTATVTVVAIDQDGRFVEGAVVSGLWSTGVSGGCTTAAVTGACSFSLNLNKKVSSATWTVGGISHATLAYVPNPSASWVTILQPF